MTTLRSFPKQYKFVNQQVFEVRLYYALSPNDEDPWVKSAQQEGRLIADYRSYDFFVFFYHSLFLCCC